MRIFDFFTKRKQKHSVSVDAVKEQNNVLLERLEKVESELAVDYHPVRAYLNKVRGRWDGKTDYIADFAHRISIFRYQSVRPGYVLPSKT